jgi:PadR family transcriptional regulator, regulatory protein PadR
MSTVMKPRNVAEKTALLQGPLDMLILRTLLFGPAHGHQIAKHIQRTTEDVLQVEHGSLYPALHRMERKGWITAKWEMPKERNREFKYYSLTAAGRKQLARQKSKWNLLAAAVGMVMWETSDDPS